MRIAMMQLAIPENDRQTADVADGTYTCEVTLQGGSGRASVDGPANYWSSRMKGDCRYCLEQPEL